MPREPGAWTARAVLALVAVLLCLGSIAFSLAQVTVVADPELAHRLAPYDGRITALLAASLAGQEASTADRRRSDALAREALGQDPTAVVAVSTLGINAQVRGDAGFARRLFAYSQTLSRRELQTQLWAIEDAVGNGDVSAALRHYDITLRVWPAMADMLFPILAQASSEPRVGRALLKMLAGRPMWGNSFVNFLAANGHSPELTARLLLALNHDGVSVPEYARTAVVNALIARGRLDEAWGYYASLHPGVDRSRSRDSRFMAALDPPSRLDWTSTNSDTIVTSAQGGVFEFTVPTGAGGSLLQQLQLLAPGDYVLAGHGAGIDQPDGARPYWTLTCPDGRELGRVTMPNSAQANGAFMGRFSVPAGCPSQTLVFMARPSDGVAGLTGQIDRVGLSPAR